MREPFTDGLYAEAGAMRLPRSHDLTMAYVERFRLPTKPFTMGNPQAWCYLHGSRHRMEACAADPACLGYPVPERERGKLPGQLWDELTAPIGERLRREGPAAWAGIVADYDQYSTVEFLEQAGWSRPMIELFGLLENQESRLNASFVELLRAEIGEAFSNMVYLDGGTDRLPNAFLPELRGRVRFGAEVVALDQTDTGVTVHYRNRAGRASVEGDRCILTLPFSVLRHVEVLKPFSWEKQRAIRQLRYDASAKVFLQCRRRFWEEDDGIFGGGSVTDLAVRNVYYPEHGRETGRGVLLASYTWADDAHRWGSLEPAERLSQAVENVAQIHPQIVDEVEGGASHAWHDDPFAAGAFCLFEPGQETDLHPHIIAPEGRCHFAGEHASLVHRWIQGAIESGLRAAWEVVRAG
jgi:monoamine oxidase